MSKLRINSRFGVTPNSLLTHKEITLRAKGLYGYIQSKPDGWDFAAERIAYETKDGRDSIRAGLKELEQYGYLQRIKTSLGRGVFETEYILHDTPIDRAKIDELSVTENPSSIHDQDAEFSGTELSSPIKPSSNKTVNTKKEIEIKKEDILSFWNDQEIIEHKKLTPSLEKQIEKTLKSFSVDDIKKGIKNYSEIFHSPRTWWSYKWTLAEFLSREKGFEVFLEKGEKDYLTDAKAPFVDKAAEVKKSQDAEARAKKQAEEEERNRQNAKREQGQILRWYESAPEGLRAEMDKEIQDDYLIKNISHPVYPDPEKGIKGDSESEIERKKSSLAHMTRIVTLKVASKHMQK